MVLQRSLMYLNNKPLMFMPSGSQPPNAAPSKRVTSNLSLSELKEHKFMLKPQTLLTNSISKNLPGWHQQQTQTVPWSTPRWLLLGPPIEGS